MITEGMMYWITRLDSIHALFATLTGIFAIVTTLFIIGWVITYCEWAEKGYKEGQDERVHKGVGKVSKWLLTAMTVSVIGLVFTPTTREAAIIYTVPAITRSDFIQKDLPDLYTAGIEALKEKLKGTQHDDTRSVEHRV